MPGAGERRFLFLQGPLSPLYRRIGRKLSAKGHTVQRINFCVGDWLHWHGSGTFAYRGRFENWPEWVGAWLERERVTNLVLHGDTRPYHRQAVIAAERLGIAVHVTELGVLRPGFMTLERGGLGVLSRFPVDADAIAQLSACAGAVDLSPQYPGSFPLEAWQDVSYHLPNVALGWLFFPHHRRHTPFPPVLDYALWIRRLIAAPARRRRASILQQSILAQDASLFVLPLQMEGDYQIVSQSQYSSMRDVLRDVLFSFARHAPGEARLVIKSHPLDNGWTDWSSEVALIASEFKLGNRVAFLDGGDLHAIVRGAVGVVTVNSTAGLEAVRTGVPVKTLAPAIYDSPGLTHQGGLDAFWNRPQPPDPVRVSAFVTALAATTQVRGTIHNRMGLDDAVEGIAARLLKPCGDDLGAAPRDPPPRLARARALGVPL